MLTKLEAKGKNEWYTILINISERKLTYIFLETSLKNKNSAREETLLLLNIKEKIRENFGAELWTSRKRNGNQ